MVRTGLLRGVSQVWWDNHGSAAFWYSTEEMPEDYGGLFLPCSSVYVSMLLVCHLVVSEKCDHGLAWSLREGRSLICCILYSGVQLCLLCWVSAAPPSLQCCALCCLLYLMVFYICYIIAYCLHIYRYKDLCSIF